MDNQSGVSYYNPNVLLKPVYKPVDKKDIAFMVLFFISAFLMVCLGFWGEFHLGFTIAYFVLFGVTTAYLFKKANTFAIVCGLLSLAGSVTLTLYNDFFINSIMLLLVGGLYTAYALGISDTFSFKQGSFKMLFDMVKSVSVRPFDAMSHVFGGIKSYANERKKSLSGFFGVLVALPVLAVIIPLLVKSDAAFEGLILSIGKNVGVTLIQLAIAAPIAIYVFSFAFEKRKQLNKKKIGNANKQRGIPASAGVSFLSVISVTYLVYLFSQLAYFFSAFKGILPEDYQYTASAFARRGFFEMFAICVINVAIVSAVSMLVKKKTIVIKLLSCFISLFSVLMIAISMQKMRLNISIYGLSKNRVMVSVFMIMLLVIIAFFMLHIFAPKISYMQPIIIICSAIFVALSFSNVDARIAEYNIKAYESGQIQDLDIQSLANLSDSSIPYVVDLMSSDNSEVSKEATRIVTELYNNTYDEDEKNDFRSYNSAHKNAVNSVKNASNPLLDNILEITKQGEEYEYDEENDEYLVYDEGQNGYGYVTYGFNAKSGLYEVTKPFMEMEQMLM